MTDGRTANNGFAAPEDTRAFSGRENEVDGVLRAVGDETVGIGWKVFAFDGEPAVGKTTLAKHLYHRLRPLFGANFAIDLHSHTAGLAPAEPAGLLRTQLAEAGKTVGHIADEQQLSAAWRAHLEVSPSLLLLDNAKDAEQVRPFLPGESDCVVLITSRQQLVDLRHDPRVELLTVLPFDDDTAVELVKRIVRRELGEGERIAITEIARLSGHLPMAIANIAARLANGDPRDTAPNLLAGLKRARSSLEGFDRLTGSTRRLTPLFKMSYEGLPDHQVTLRRLGLIPGSRFDEYSVAAIADKTYDEAEAALRALSDNSLLSYEKDYFKMHDLFRAYMQAKAHGEDSEADRLTALNRLIGYYQDTAARADRHFARHVRPATFEIDKPSMGRRIGDRDEALAWMRAEQDNLLASIDMAAQMDGESARLHRDRWIVGLTASIAAFLRNEGLWHKGEQLHQQALQAAARLGDKIAEANALSELGFVHRLLGSFEEAKTNATDALALYRREGNRLGEANALGDIALLVNLKGDHQGSIDGFQQALSIYQELGERLGEANISNDLGFTLRTAGRKRDAVTSFERAGELFGALDNRLGQAHAVYLRGATLREITDESDEADRLAQAAAVLAQALDIYRHLGNSLGEANALTHLGGVQRATGHLDQAFELLTEAFTIHTRIKNRRGLADVHRELGTAYSTRARGEAAAAISHLQTSLSLYQDLRLATADDVAEQLARLREQTRKSDAGNAGGSD